jgi:hypothetical protein
MTTTTALILVLVLVVAAAVALYFLRERRTARLRSRYGPEYERTVRELGNRTKAEEELITRERRVEKFHIHALSPGERDSFADQWHQVQAHFVDDPAGSIRQADDLVCDVMKARGYPMAEFDNRADDLSVHYPHVVRNYRAAHEIAMLQDQGQVSTEDLRKALVYYRNLFDELLEAHSVGHSEVRDVREVREVRR